MAPGYRRGYFDDGTQLGSSTSDQCRIDSIAQSWSVTPGRRIRLVPCAPWPPCTGSSFAAMFRAQARTVKVLEKDPTPHIHYFIAETGGLLEPHELQTWRLLHVAP